MHVQKGDIIMSLQSRLDIICDEADADTDENESIDGVLPDKLISQADLQLLRKPSTLSFPQRVFAPWLAGTYICDYLQPSETLQVLKDHCAELLSVEVQTDAFKILEPELEVSSEIAKSFWEAVTPSNSTSKSLVKELSSNSTRSSSFSIIAAVIVLLLSILVGFLFLAAF
ncbi:hypothetical protein CRG98_006488 [Punica granatum]|uniref:Uncharacterized protein n=1 Tax=Punica granatum TaxID=22663 RepID=A0A2I0KXL1_PUNGR|nr:hypothetical protein CRG98_006488 [Punica granatum]